MSCAKFCLTSPSHSVSLIHPAGGIAKSSWSARLPVPFRRKNWSCISRISSRSAVAGGTHHTERYWCVCSVNRESWSLRGCFFRAAERYDLMPSVDLWVVRNTFAWWAARCADSGARSTGLVSINLSGKSLGNEPFQDKVLSLISEYQILPGTVCFEITENGGNIQFRVGNEIYRPAS